MPQKKQASHGAKSKIFLVMTRIDWLKILVHALMLSVIFLTIIYLIQPIRSSPGMWYVHDDVHVVRTQEMVKELVRGQFPVRWLHDLGNSGGYPLFNFYPPLIYYLSAGLVLAGSHPLHAVKLVFMFSYLVASLGMYAFIYRLAKSPVVAGLGALLFITSVYFNYNTYTRGALAELAGMALIPWVFLSLEVIFESKRSVISIITFSLMMTVLLYTHAITAIGVIIFIGLRILIAHFQGKLHNWKRLLWAAGLTLGLSASFTLPLVLERNLVSYQQTQLVTAGYLNGFVRFVQLMWLPMSSSPQPSIGIGLVTLFIFSLVMSVVASKKSIKKSHPYLIFSLLGLAVSVFLISPLSQLLWQFLPFLKLMQFPYRFLTLATFFICTSIVLILTRFKFLPLITLFFLLPIVIYSQKAYYVTTGYYFTDTFLAEDECSTTTWQQELLPRSVTDCLPKGTSDLTSSSSSVDVGSAQVLDSGKVIVTGSSDGGDLIINRYAYPDWQATLNDLSVELMTQPYTGLIMISIPPGEFTFELSLDRSAVKFWSDWLTILSLAIMILILGYSGVGYIKFDFKSK